MGAPTTNWQGCRAYSSTRCFLFTAENFHFRLQFFCSQLMNCRNLWKLGASQFHLSTCQPGNRSEYIHVEVVLVQGPDPSRPCTQTHHPSLAACIKALPLLGSNSSWLDSTRLDSTRSTLSSQSSQTQPVEQVETSVSSETSRALPTWRTTNDLVQV